MFRRAPVRLSQRVLFAQARARAAAYTASSARCFLRVGAGFATATATAVVLGGVAVVACAPAFQAPPFDVAAVRADIEALVGANMSLGPLFVRLAWHEAGSWDCKKKDGAPNSASMRFKPECAYGGNNGLGAARNALEPLKKKYPSISYADLWVLAAYTAIEYMGGPHIPFNWGRKDAPDGSVCAPNDRLPDGSKTQDHVREVFTRLGFNDQETVALIGAHTCGECHLENSGFVGPWTHDKYGFDNSFFLALLEEKWELNPKVANLQFMDESTQKLMMLPADVALVLDPTYKKYVELYAKDNERFGKDFAAAFQKLTENGTSGLRSAEK